MKTYKNLFSLGILLFIISLSFSAINASAAMVPTLSLSFVDSINTRVSVYGDPNSTVELHYGPSAVAVKTMGKTDQGGNYTTTLSSNSYSLSSCNQTAYVVVGGQQSQTITWAAGNTSCSPTSSTYPAFSQNNVVINVGQNISISIIGNGGYTLASNSSPSTITPNINGNTLNLYASAFGSSNIRICESDGQCNTLNIVAVTSGAQTTVNPATLPASLSSFSVSSSNANGSFMNSGSILTLSFTANQQVGNVLARIGGTSVSISGNGSGPYTGSYTITGNEGSSIPVNITFANLAGTATQTNFSLGGSNSTSVSNTNTTTTTDPNVGCTSTTKFSTVTGQLCPVTASNTTTTTAAPVVIAPAAPAKGNGYKFSTFIQLGDNGTEVTELQKRLTVAGVYTGPVNGNFGALTEAAVKKFQAKYNIKQAGYVGPSTSAALNKI